MNHKKPNITEVVLRDGQQSLIATRMKTDDMKPILSKMDKDKTKILDIGCGSGEHIKLLSDNDYNVIGLDNSKEMVKKYGNDPIISWWG